MSQWANEPMSQWANEPMSQWANEPMSQWGSLGVCTLWVHCLNCHKWNLSHHLSLHARRLPGSLPDLIGSWSIEPDPLSVPLSHHQLTPEIFNPLGGLGSSSFIVRVLTLAIYNKYDIVLWLSSICLLCHRLVHSLCTIIIEPVWWHRRWPSCHDTPS
jgi:hypothetical protein